MVSGSDPHRWNRKRLREREGGGRSESMYLPQDSSTFLVNNDWFWSGSFTSKESEPMTSLCSVLLEEFGVSEKALRGDPEWLTKEKGRSLWQDTEGRCTPMARKQIGKRSLVRSSFDGEYNHRIIYLFPGRIMPGLANLELRSCSPRYGAHGGLQRTPC